MQCSNCGHSHGEDAKFCGSCGRAVADVVRHHGDVAVQSTMRVRKPTSVFLLVCLVVGVAGLSALAVHVVREGSLTGIVERPTGTGSVVQSAESPQLRENDCEAGATNVADVYQCVETKQSAAVEQAVERLSARLSPDARNALQQAQVSWRTFVRDSCELFAEMKNNDFSMGYRSDVIVNCRGDFHAARVKILNAYVRQLTEKAK